MILVQKTRGIVMSIVGYLEEITNQRLRDDMRMLFPTGGGTVPRSSLRSILESMASQVADYHHPAHLSWKVDEQRNTVFIRLSVFGLAGALEKFCIYDIEDDSDRCLARAIRHFVIQARRFADAQDDTGKYLQAHRAAKLFLTRQEELCQPH